MKFPKWAPKPLIEHYFLRLGADYLPEWPGESRLLLESLLTHPRMKSVWKEITKQSGLKTNETRGDEIYAHIIFHVNRALHVSKRAHTTRQEDVERYEEIAKQARKLSRAIKNSRLDVTPYRWYPNDAVETILARLRTRLMLSHFYTGRPSKQQVLKQILLTEDPTMSCLLESLAEESDSLVERTAKEQRLIGKPGAKNTQRIAFIREMARFFKREFGGPLYQTLAGLSSVALEDDAIDKAAVIDALRGWEIIGD